MSMRFFSSIVFALGVVAANAASAQSAQSAQSAPTLPIERFRVPIDDTGLGTTESGNVPPHLSVHTAVVFIDAVNPLVLTDDQGRRISSVVANRLAASLAASVGLFEQVSIGAELPVVIMQNSGDLGALAAVASPFAVSGIGDLKLVPKVRLLREEEHVISLAILPALSVPTASGFDFASGSAQYGESYLGEGPGAFAFLPEVAVSTHLSGVRLAGNLSYRLRGTVSYFDAFEIYPEIGLRLGAGYDLKPLLPDVEGLIVYAELFGATADRNPFGVVVDTTLAPAVQELKAIERRLQNALEWSAGARLTLLPGLSVEGGAGAGMAPGYGSPDFRVYAGARYVIEDRDADEDGIKDSLDLCPKDPEDKDGFEDADGCAEFDNDKDGVGDGADRCPNTVGPREYKGCPPPDADRDEIPDDKDRCPNSVGKPQNEGCPDSDGDGVIDMIDQCPGDAGRAELHGCPPPPDQDQDGVIDSADVCVDRAGDPKWAGCPDSDADGVPDNHDDCPDALEVMNGIDDHDGCPDQGKIVLKADRIETLEPVMFDTGKATIKKQSAALLDQIAALLLSRPEITLSIEGHTDSDGNPTRNLDLSEARAGAVVDALVSRGVDVARLRSIGFGDTRPVATNSTRKGKAQNRRVELLVVPSEVK